MWFKKRIFLDSAGGQGNPSAIHAEGREAKRKLEEARTKVARLLRCGARDVIFMSGGTEADNLAVLGVCRPGRLTQAPHVIISSVEHPAVVESAKEAERRGAKVSVFSAADFKEEDFIKLITPETVLISVSLVDGITGSIQPVQKIARLVREYRKKNNTNFPYVHTDASQAASMLDVSVDSLGVDMMTLDGSKFDAGEGRSTSGLLVVRPNVELHPIIFGGGQERGLRSGTENISSIIAFADALEKAFENREAEAERLGALREYFVRELQKNIPEILIHQSEYSSEKNQAPHIVAVSVPGILSEYLAVALDEAGVSASAGSACASGSQAADDDVLLRFSFGSSTTQRELGRALGIFVEIVHRAKMGA